MDPSRHMYRSARRTAAAGLGINLALGADRNSSAAWLAIRLRWFPTPSIRLAIRLARRSCCLRSAWPKGRPILAHPYGHTRAEAVAGLSIAWLMAFSAVLVGWEAISHLADQHSPPAAWTLWIAGGERSCSRNCYIASTSRMGEQLGSQSLVANAWDHRSDALCSLAVLIGIAAVRWGGPTSFGQTKWLPLLSWR